MMTAVARSVEDGSLGTIAEAVSMKFTCVRESAGCDGDNSAQGALLRWAALTMVAITWWIAVRCMISRGWFASF